MSDFIVSFKEDFNYTGKPNPEVWIVNGFENNSANGYPGGPDQFGTDEIETVRSNNVEVVPSKGLVITPTKEGGTWFSSRIETKKVFKPSAGSVMRVEAEIQLPDVHGSDAAGYWPAFWMMGETQRDMRWEWPASGEFDITESVNGVNRNWSTLHGGPKSLWGGPFNEPSGYSNGGVAPSSGDIWGQFHKYAFEWDRSTAVDELRWYVDGVQVHSAKPSVISAGDWKNMSQHPGYFIIVNVAMGGQFPAALGGGPTGATKPGVPMITRSITVSYKGSEAPEVAQGNDGTGTGTGTENPPTEPTDPVDPPVDPTEPTDPPAVAGAPSNLRVTGKTANTVTIGWDGTEGSYDILRSGVKITSVTSKSFTDFGLGQNVPYIYSVRAAGVTTPELTVILDGSTVITPPVDPEIPPVVVPVTKERNFVINLKLPVTGDPIIIITESK